MAGGSRKGDCSGAFCNPSCGGSRSVRGVGGTHPPRLSPEGKRERDESDSLLPQADSVLSLEWSTGRSTERVGR
jgi:hypothetical protein